MRILNIVEVTDGELDNIESFVVLEDNPEVTKPEIILLAEEVFKKKAIEHGCKDPEIWLKEKYWASNGYKVYLSYSDVNI